MRPTQGLPLHADFILTVLGAMWGDEIAHIEAGIFAER